MKQKQNRLVVLNLYMKKHFSKLLINLIIALFLEVIVFNITSYRVLLGNFEKKEFTNLEFVQYDDEKVILKIDNLDIEVGTVKLNFDKNLTEVSEYRIGFSDETSSRFRNLQSLLKLSGMGLPGRIQCWRCGLDLCPNSWQWLPG